MSVILNARHERVEPVAVEGPWLPGLQAWRVGNRVGESPCWDPSTQTLLWIDVRAPALLRLDPETNALTRWTLPEVVGAMGLAAEGRVVLALRRRLALFDMGSGRLEDLLEVADEPEHNRLNDGKVSPSGRWFVFGSMDDRATDKPATGALYRAAMDGGVQRLVPSAPAAEGLTVANGIAFSPDARTIYHADSHAGRVWQAPWDEITGTMGQAGLLCSPDEAAGRPDGAAVAADGSYWSAGVSAGCLNRYGAQGELLEKLPLPCRAPTMPCFGGADLRTLFVTSLVRPGWTVGPGGWDGALFSGRAACQGLPMPHWR
jgi:sugar lactone lactonase YvrE